MPKNAVQKLQELKNDINTVISLYEVASKPKNHNNDKSETTKNQNSQQLSQISSAKYLEAIPRFDKFREMSGKQISLFDSLKKAGSFITRPSQGLNPRQSVLGKKWTQNKPGSAPSSSSTICTAESDYLRQQSDTIGVSERGILAKAKTSENLSISECPDNDVFPDFGPIMTPSKTLETAKEILEKNNFQETESLLLPAIFCEESENEKNRTEGTTNSALNGKGTVKRSPNIHKLKSVRKSFPKNSAPDVKSRTREEKSLERSRSVSPREQISIQHFIERNLPPSSKSMITAKVQNSKKKSLVDSWPKLSAVPKEEVKLLRKASTTTNQKNIKSPTSKRVCSKDKKGEPPIENEKDPNLPDKTAESKFTLPQKNSSILKHAEKFLGGDKPDCKKSRVIFEKEKTVHFIEVEGDVQISQQKEEKPAKEIDEPEFWANELANVIEISNEKLETMKVSKELALDIANHFKEKYDEIQKSKGELLKKLQMAELLRKQRKPDTRYKKLIL